jgi:hypothetical protein
MIAWLSGQETRWERKAALGIKGKYHEWDYPTGFSIVNQLVAAERAKSIVLGSTRLSARGALHLAVTEQHSIGRIFRSTEGVVSSNGWVSRVHTM